MNERLTTYDSKMTKTLNIWMPSWQQSVQDAQIPMCWTS